MRIDFDSCSPEHYFDYLLPDYDIWASVPSPGWSFARRCPGKRREIYSIRLKLSIRLAFFYYRM